jgi:hypothetical protein
LENLKREVFENNAITGATISPDASKVLLLCHSLFGFQNFTSDNFFWRNKQFKLNHFHKEAICFKDNSTLLIADEKE